METDHNTLVENWLRLQIVDPKRMETVGLPYEGACTTHVVDGKYQITKKWFGLKKIVTLIGFECLVCGKEM